MDNSALPPLKRFGFLIGFVVVIWAIHLLQVISGIDLIRLGVFPRSLEGLPGILTTPLIHGSWGHLFSNSLSFLMLGVVLFWFYPRIALRSIIVLYLFSGLGIWIFAQPNSYHIGASGVVYGMVSLVFWSGIFRRNIKSIVLALIVLVLYAGFFEGIVPGKKGISWEGHLSGAIVGIVLAWVYRKDIEEDEIQVPVVEEMEERDFFLPRDAFDMTMSHRRALRDQEEREI